MGASGCIRRRWRSSMRTGRRWRPRQWLSRPATGDTLHRHPSTHHWLLQQTLLYIVALPSDHLHATLQPKRSPPLPHSPIYPTGGCFCLPSRLPSIDSSVFQHACATESLECSMLSLNLAAANLGWSGSSGAVESTSSLDRPARPGTKLAGPRPKATRPMSFLTASGLSLARCLPHGWR